MHSALGSEPISHALCFFPELKMQHSYARRLTACKWDVRCTAYTGLRDGYRKYMNWDNIHRQISCLLQAILVTNISDLSELLVTMNV
jgi:hypothetical protein